MLTIATTAKMDERRRRRARVGVNGARVRWLGRLRLARVGLRLGARKLVGARALALGLDFRLARAAALEIGAIARLQLRGEVGPGIERARLGQPLALMREPSLPPRRWTPSRAPRA